MSNNTKTNGAGVSHTLQNVRITRDDERWETEVSAEIPAADISRHYEDSVRQHQKEVVLDGFRKGHAPKDRVVAHVGEGALLRDAAERAIQEQLPLLLAGESLPIVETPRVSIAPPRFGEALTFTARAGLAHETTLPDYKAIAKKITDEPFETNITDEEFAAARTHLCRERARIEKAESGIAPEKAAEEARAMKEDELPPLDDAFAQSIGYENGDAFAEALRTNMKTEKEAKEREVRRAAILQDITKASKVRYPAILKEYELEEMEAKLQDDLSRMGLTMEGYLAQTKKTRDELIASWSDAADTRAKTRIVLSEIARAENIVPSAEVVNHELEHAKERYKSANPEALRAHIINSMRNEMVLRMLEGDATPVGHATHDTTE